MGANGLPKITLQFKQDVANWFHQKADQIGDISEPLRVVTWSCFGNRVQRYFNEQRSPLGIPWTPLSPTTIKARINKDPTKIKILQDTGKLKNSLYASAFQHIGAQIAGKNVVVYGTPVKYAPWHELGTRHLPARPFMPTSQEDARAWCDEVSDLIEQVLT